MAGRDALEVERKYTVDQSTPAPRLVELPGVERTGKPVTHYLNALYFDTADLVLAAHGITLRRRTGGLDAGWHLKLPAPKGARTEVTEPLGAEDDGEGAPEVPQRLRGLVAVHVRGRELVPVARLRTRRLSFPLLDASGTVLAEATDDHVDAEALLPPPGDRNSTDPEAGAGRTQAWREWELELVDGSEDLLEAADRLLADAGVHPAELPSKLARALGPSYPSQPGQRRTPKRKGPAAVVLQDYLQRQADALKAADPEVRRDAPDSVHQLRVSARRMRSALATYRPLVDADAANHLRDELKWLAHEVGDARDVEVMRERLVELAEAEPDELLMGDVVERIEQECASGYREAHATGLEALDSERYFRLLDALDAFVADPPLERAGRKKAHKAVAKLVAKDLKRLQKAVRAAEDAEDAAESGDAEDSAVDEALHEVRKKAKRLRYAAEAAGAVHGKRAAKTEKAAEEIQEVLGDLQDSVVSRDFLRELAVQAHAEGVNTFSLGRLHALEQETAVRARESFERQWIAFRKDAKPL
ncbi:CYTH and CHAD domain-containing protein [Sinomonas halotolerans]|uniref:CYTH and CHAD domain-containing protein n=1 Tax=Sinomonas halotolerans TaxID=1644133 RepID=A0ABU9X0I9_9MICC